jgi:hypothetical protein
MFALSDETSDIVAQIDAAERLGMGRRLGIPVTSTPAERRTDELARLNRRIHDDAGLPVPNVTPEEHAAILKHAALTRSPSRTTTACCSSMRAHRCSDRMHSTSALARRSTTGVARSLDCSTTQHCA